MFVVSQTFFPICAQTIWHMETTNPTSCLKESYRTWGYMYMCCQALKDTLSLRQNWAHLCRGIHASCCSPACSGCSWPSPSLVGVLPSMGAHVQGERPAHARGASRGLGEGRRTGEKQALHDFRLFWGVVVLNEPNSYIILFIVSSLFSDFPHRIQCSPESYSKPARHFHSSWGDSHPELSIWDSSEPLSHFLVQTASQWRDDLPYWSWFF